MTDLKFSQYIFIHFYRILNINGHTAPSQTDVLCFIVKIWVNPGEFVLFCLR